MRLKTEEVPCKGRKEPMRAAKTAEFMEIRRGNQRSATPSWRELFRPSLDVLNKK